MKKILISLILILASVVVNAQDVKKILTSGKWHVVSTQEAGEEPEESEDKNDEWIVFLPDGKTQESYFGDSVKSNWTYSIKERTIKLSGKEDKVQKVIEATDDKLVIESFENGQGGLIITYAK